MMKIQSALRCLLALCLLLPAEAGWSAPREAGFNRIEKHYTLYPDGSREFRCKKELTLHTHLAFNSLYGETFIVYNPQYQSLKFHAAYTRQADGTRVEVPANGFNEVLPRAAAYAPAYNHLKEMVVTHTGLEVGATIYLDYSVLTGPGYYPELDIDNLCRESSPVKEYTVTVTVPESKKLAYALTGSETKPAVSRENGAVRYAWTWKNIPAASREPLQPLDSETAVRLSAATYPSGEAARAGFVRQFNDTLSAKDKESALALIRTFPATNQALLFFHRNDTVTILHNYVATQIKTIPVALHETGYTLRPAAEVFHSAYGTPAEKAGLLLAMLKSAGYEPHLLMSYPPAHTHGLETMRELAVACNGKIVSPEKDAEPAMINRGALDRIFSFPEIPGDPFPSGYKKSVEHMRTDSLTETELRILSADGYVAKKGMFSTGDGIDTWPVGRLNSVRKEVLELPYLYTEKYEVVIRIPEGVSVETPDSELRIDKPFGSLAICIRTEGNKVTVSRSLDLKQQQIGIAEYPAFRAFIRPWFDENRTLVLFRKN